jgi:hypothetical protein
MNPELEKYIRENTLAMINDLTQAETAHGKVGIALAIARMLKNSMMRGLKVSTNQLVLAETLRIIKDCVRTRSLKPYQEMIMAGVLLGLEVGWDTAKEQSEAKH